jgi:hypothetical protein
VQNDCLVPIDGSYYPVPEQPEGATMNVHIDPDLPEPDFDRAAAR